MIISFGLGFWATVLGTLVALFSGTMPQCLCLDVYFGLDCTGFAIRLEPVYVVETDFASSWLKTLAIITLFNVIFWEKESGLAPPTLQGFTLRSRLRFPSAEWYALRIMQHELVHVQQFRSLGLLTFLALLDPDYESQDCAFLYSTDVHTIGINAPSIPCLLPAGLPSFPYDFWAWVVFRFPYQFGL